MKFQVNRREPGKSWWETIEADSVEEAFKMVPEATMLYRPRVVKKGAAASSQLEYIGRA